MENKFKLTQRIDYLDLRLIDAYTLAAMVDACLRISQPQGGAGPWPMTWEKRTMIQTGFVFIEVVRQPAGPISLEVYSIEPDPDDWERPATNFCWLRALAWPEVIQIRSPLRSPSRVNALFGHLLCLGIAPDSGHDAVLRAFYSVGGVVNLKLLSHRFAVRDALARNPELWQFLSPEFSARFLVA